MRLDKFLKLSRIVKRRTVANKVCTAKKVFVNGKVAKASTKVKPNDILKIEFGENTVNLKIVEIFEFCGKDKASSMYEVI